MGLQVGHCAYAHIFITKVGDSDMTEVLEIMDIN